jgi:hypothetical protein
MILTSTYRDQTTLSRDLLGAYSALDHVTTAALTPQALTIAFERLLQRLAVLAALHGNSVPAEFLSALTTVGEDIDVVDLTAGFLEHGTATMPEAASEIQQEIVHFSRIVDIGQLGLGDAHVEHALRRLRGSQRLPDSLKVLSELIVVVRSRLSQRGRLFPAPQLRPDATEESDTGADVTTAVPPENPGYWVAVRCGRRRIRRQFRYELSMLLAYLTPTEAALALWAHCHEQRLPLPVELAVVTADARGGITVTQWTYEPAACLAGSDVVTHVAQRLPAITRLGSHVTVPIKVGAEAYQFRAGKPISASIIDAASGATAATLTVPAQASGPCLADLAQHAADLIAAYIGPDLVSLECGHIHLMDLDIDQDTGAAIGAALLETLTQRQARPPVLTPMMDDDHVLIRLTPHAYRNFLEHTFGTAVMHLICESSPIIRSIVVTLFDKMTNSRLSNRFRRRGANLFLPLADGTHCELFEDIDADKPITGCVFFEAALLIYRTAPARFDTYFTDRFALTAPAHELAAAILSGTEPHDTKVARLGEFYARFAGLTDPRRPDRKVADLVAGVLVEAAPVTAHLNVLEDYYEVQQHKVREFLALLGLPLRLVTVHFNTTSGRVVCDG